MLINHSEKDTSEICKVNGAPLHGEKDMYERIVNDCEASTYTWHMFYDTYLGIPVNGKPGIQIDFFLICPKGVVIIEVKGGPMVIREGKYWNYEGRKSSPLKISPFKQAENYKWALINNHILNKNEVFISTICAFPHANLDKTSEIAIMDNSYKLWSAIQHKDSTKSIAEFCLAVLDKERNEAGWVQNDFTEREMNHLKDKFAPTIRPAGSYTETSIQELLDWLKADNIDTLESLSKNNRIFIEGGPGTGKTTIAKAYIDKYSDQKGLYICWNQLLAAKMRHLLAKKGLTNCAVETIDSFLIKISNRAIFPKDFEDPKVLLPKVSKALKEYKATSNPNYSYIIIDELHDSLDRGALEILKELSAINANGLTNGRYMVFFDGLQGYNNQGRNLEELASEISNHSAMFTLTKNRRVPQNSEIHEISNQIRESDSYDEIQEILKDIETGNNLPIKIQHFSDAPSLVTEILNKTSDICNNSKGKQYILLTHSNIDRTIWQGEITITRAIEFLIEGATRLNKDNINTLGDKTCPWTSILRYKGLECNNVILVVKNEEELNYFELYIGMTRAVVSVEILILD